MGIAERVGASATGSRQRTATPRGASERAAPRGKGALTAMVLVAAAYFIPRGASWNADTHLFLTASIVDRGSLNIDPFAGFTGDVAAAHGHFFADKAPGLSLLAVPVYALLKLTLLGGHPLTSVYALPEAQRTDFLVRYLLALVCAGVPTAIVTVLLYRFLPRLGVGVRWSAGLALTYALGTIARPFAGQLFSHQLAAMLVFGAFVIVFRVRRHEADDRLALVAGLLLGTAVITEYPTALIAGCLAIYALWSDGNVNTAMQLDGAQGAGRDIIARLDWRRALLLGAGAAPPLLVGALYNSLAFGSPLSTGYANLAGPDVFRAGQAQGLLGVTWPHLDALWSTTIGPFRGIFLLSPVLLLAIPGLRAFWRLAGWRAEAVICLGIVGLYGLFSISYYMWDGGYSMGPRQFLPALPFLIVPIGILVREDADARWRRFAFLLAIVSIAFVELATAASPLVNPIYPSPLTDWALPRLLAGKLDNNWGMLFGLPGLIQLAPLAIALGLLYWRHWRAAGKPATLPARDDNS